MNNFNEFYNHAVNIANTTFGNKQAKEKIRDTILFMCAIYAQEIQRNINLKKELENYLSNKLNQIKM